MLCKNYCSEKCMLELFSMCILVYILVLRITASKRFFRHKHLWNRPSPAWLEGFLMKKVKIKRSRGRHNVQVFKVLLTRNIYSMYVMGEIHTDKLFFANICKCNANYTSDTWQVVCWTLATPLIVVGLWRLSKSKPLRWICAFTSFMELFLSWNIKW